MAFNLRPYGQILKDFMYGDKCTISRRSTGVVDQYGATNPNSRTNIYKDIPCKFSFTNIDVPNDSNGSNVPVIKQVKVFTTLDYNIVSGDLIEGERMDPVSQITQPIKGKCGEPNRFDTHQEIPIEIDEVS